MGNHLTCIGDFLTDEVSGSGEPAFFIKLAVIGDKGFGNQTQDSALVEQCHTVESLVIRHNGNTDGNDHIQFCCFRSDFFQCLFCCLNERKLEEQVTAV